MAVLKHWMARIAESRASLIEALDAERKSLKFAKQAGTSGHALWCQALALVGIGKIEASLNNTESSLAAYENALPIFQKLKIVSRETDCLYGLGETAFERSDHPVAISTFNKDQELFAKKPAQHGIANCTTSSV